MSINSSYVSQATLQSFIKQTFLAAGLPDVDAEKAASLMAQADLIGQDGHGVFRLPMYIKRIQAEGLNTRPQLKVIEERVATTLIDGDNGLGHLVMSHAAELAMQKAKTTGVAWVGARHSNHAGPASLYAMMPAQKDMIGLYVAVGSANHLPPWGGSEMLLNQPDICRDSIGREPADCPGYGDHRCCVWQSQNGSAARRNNARRLDD